MAITNATRLSDFGSGIGTAGAVLKVDNTNQRVGIGTTDPRGMLQVGTAITMNGNTGVITATSFEGSGANLTCVSGFSLPFFGHRFTFFALFQQPNHCSFACLP